MYDDPITARAIVDQPLGHEPKGRIRDQLALPAYSQSCVSDTRLYLVGSLRVEGLMIILHWGDCRL